MSDFMNKVDFIVLAEVRNANPNGDPLNGNRPRINQDGFGEISDVCIKRKIRNRLQDMGENIFVQSDERRSDEYKSLNDRTKSCLGIQEAQKAKDSDKYAEAACLEWMDVRSFGQVFAFKGSSVSVGVRGPVSVHTAVSVSPIDISSMQITKSVNSESKEGKASDTMGMKHRVDFGVYVIKGSINKQLADKTGFSNEDADKIKETLKTLFINDSSSARPDGSMEVKKVYWWRHSSEIGQYSSAKVHNSLQIVEKSDNPTKFEEYEIVLNKLEGLEPEVYDGI